MLFEPIHSEYEACQDEDQPHQARKAHDHDSAQRGRMPLERGHQPGRDAEEQEEPGLDVNELPRDQRDRQQGQGTNQTWAHKAAETRPGPGQRGQSHAQTREQQQIRQRPQPEKVPAHQVERLGHPHLLAEHAGRHLEPTRCQAAPDRQQEYIQRAQPGRGRGSRG